jgi:hypothetical protein
MSKKPPVYFEQAELEAETKKHAGLLEIGLKKYERFKERGENIARLDKSMFYEMNGPVSKIEDKTITEGDVPMREDEWKPDSTMIVSENQKHRIGLST